MYGLLATLGRVERASLHTERTIRREWHRTPALPSPHGGSARVAGGTTGGASASCSAGTASAHRSAGALAVAGAVLVGAVVVAVLRSGTGDRVAAAVAYGTVVGMPMAVGLLAWRAQPDERFARLLVAVGAVSAPTAFSRVVVERPRTASGESPCGSWSRRRSP